jgi:RimJ/RimL family protein N-acetyltransferase
LIPIRTILVSRLVIEELRVEHLAELAKCLHRNEVYEHIGGLPSREDFILDREIALSGPGPAAPDERWLNFLVRERSSNNMLGRLEATVHDSIAEVAFLFDPDQWGKGFAREALAWLHEEIEHTSGVTSFWATTVPENTRCQALLTRSGYQQVHSGEPVLYSFDAGDLVFHARGGAKP